MEAPYSRFTAAEGGARLATAAGTKNILAVEHAAFIATRLIHEQAFNIRGRLHEGRQRSVYVTRASRVACVAYDLHLMTDLAVTSAETHEAVHDWCAELDKNEVLVCTSSVLRQILEEGTLSMNNINVLIIDSAHLVWRDVNLQFIMKLYKEHDADTPPRILALTYPLFNTNKKPIDNTEVPTIDEALPTHEDNKEVPTIDEALPTDEDNTEVPTVDEALPTHEDNTEVPTVVEALPTHEEKVPTAELKEADKEVVVVKENETSVNDYKVKNEDVMGRHENIDDYDMYEKLEWKIEELEKELCCEMDLAEDIDGGKRLSSNPTKPKELIIEYSGAPSAEVAPLDYRDLCQYMKDTVTDALEFINEHRYDPTEIYGEDLYEEFKNIPDPTIEPKYIFKQFLYVLDQLGPYAADKAAFSLLAKLEKLKIKVPYERHFILLCLCTTVFVKIRCHADTVFAKYDSDWMRIKSFSTPKVLRLAEVLFKFQPPETQKTTEEVTSQMLGDLEKCDFKTLGDKIEDTVNTFESNLKDLDQFNLEMKTSDVILCRDNSKISSIESVSLKSVDSEISVNSDTKESSNVSNSVSSEENSESVANTKDNENNLIVSQNQIAIISKTASSDDNSESVIIPIDQNRIVNNDCVISKSASSDDNSRTVFITTEDNTVNQDQITSVNKVVTTLIKPDLFLKPDGMLREGKLGFSRRSGGRVRGRGRTQRTNTARVHQMQQNPDALCGIVFMREALVAKIMFMVIADMSRAHPRLAYLCTQYCAEETPANPGTEPKECQRQGKKQEEVLKKFRMHECNLLLATSALEEGIDLPRCNLVLRWDVPASYRSYGLCRGRARASRCSCAVLCCGSGTNTQELVHNLATYRELDQIISRKCGCGIQDEPPETEENAADIYTSAIKAYTPEGLTKIITFNDNQSNDKNYDRETEITKNVTDVKINDAHVIVTDLQIINKDVGVIEDVTKSECIKIIADNDLNQTIEKNKCDSRLVEIENSTQKEDTLISDFDDLKIDERTFNDKAIIGDNDSSASVKVSDINISVSSSVNSICNKCNQFKISDSVECPCLNVKLSDSPVRSNSAVEKTSKSVSDSDIATVDLSTSIALINRYCGKLPSDTFTRLAPQWWMEEVQLPVPGSPETKTAYICTLRLPLNCPVKYNIVGHPMPTRVLARRMAALQACRILHKSGELDNQLMPIGKENFKAADLDGALGCNGADASEAGDAARPGTTKRRQYYYKKTAWAFTDCQPVIDTPDSETEPSKDNNIPRELKPEPINKGPKRNMLYAIVSKLWCALPERYNTRGRRLHAPQHASQAIGILMAREHADELQIPAFPVYTRSGEVRVSVEYVPDADVAMSPKRDRLVRRFMRFVFAEVLRVRRRGMKLCSEGSTHNNYYIVPTHRVTKADGTSHTDVDWGFLHLIYQHTEQLKRNEVERPQLFQDGQEPQQKAESDKERTNRAKEIDNPLLKPGEVFTFNAEHYKEAVVTPWYRNQDQPQFFLVAEICWNLTPDSAFPSATHSSFRDYYLVKYGAKLTQAAQPLLDVDHTSARLNLLTPRYVNRKGVALPVSSERTRRAKRDRLDQKQILVPELCKVHPFAAPLWFATVALPCVLYRINALLIADEVRRAVAAEVGLGAPAFDEATCPGFRWPPLDFGWSLAEVLSVDSEKGGKKTEDDDDDTKDEKENGKEEDDKKGTEDEKTETDAPKEKTANDILQEKMDLESGFEIGTWSNDMASSIPEPDDYDELLEPLPPNLTFCTSASGGTNWCEPIEKPKSQYNPSRTFSMAESDCSYMSSDFDTDDSDLNSESDEDTESSGFWSKGSLGVRIEYKTAHEAEAFDVERKSKVNPAPQPNSIDDAKDREAHHRCIREGVAPPECIEKFRTAVTKHETEIMKDGNLITVDKAIRHVLPETKDHRQQNKLTVDQRVLNDLFPYGDGELKTINGQLTLESIEKNKRVLLEKLKSSLSKDDIKKLNCFSMVDVDIDSPSYVNEKVANVGFDDIDSYKEKINDWDGERVFKPYYHDSRSQGKHFDFDYQPPLEGHPGPSPSVILQALTMSNANDGINLERLETIGDSFLKLAITAYLYCAHPAVHEGKLSHMRSKQVSNLNLYRLGRLRRLGARMTASKFEPHDNWLPPCHRPPHAHHASKSDNQESMNIPDAAVASTGCFIPYNLITQHSIPDKSIADCVEALIGAYLLECGPRGALLFMSWLGIKVLPRHDVPLPDNHPYVKDELTRSEKKPPNPAPKPPPRVPIDSESSCSSDADEPWLEQEEPPPIDDWAGRNRPVGSLRPYRNERGQWVQPIFGELKAPPSPLLRYVEDPEGELEQMLSGYDALERTLQYRFRDRSLLLQALTHASHQSNRLTDCYQRLEFLGDAVLDYLITRHLYEDARRHSPGALTDLRSALVNNTIFATLAARHGFHKYFRHMSPGLNEVLTRYVKIQEENGHSISEEHYLIQEDEMEQAEDVEVPKALGDLFESVAGAIFLDSGMSLGAVWRSYVSLMGAELEAFSAAAPKSPVRELLEAEPDTAKFGKPERLADGRRVRVCVEVFGRGAFKGVGRNYRIAKGTAARCALRHLRPSRKR